MRYLAKLPIDLTPVREPESLACTIGETERWPVDAPSGTLTVTSIDATALTVTSDPPPYAFTVRLPGVRS